MTETAVYLLAGLGLVFANVMAWIATWFGLPGTWVIVAVTALVCHFFPSRGGTMGLDWWSVGVLAVLAVIGEFWETGAAAASARKAGATRRGATYGLIGGVVGGFVGGIVGAPVPIVGSIIAALLGAAGGAFAGAWYGEGRTGRPLGERFAVGRAAAGGRVWGTLGKIAIGFVMVAVSTVAYFL